MQPTAKKTSLPKSAHLANVALFAGLLSGCGGNVAPVTPPPVSQPAPQLYMSPFVAGTTNGGNSFLGSSDTQTYTFDDVGGAFQQTTYVLSPPAQQGAQVINAGPLAATTERGLLNLTVAINYNPTPNGLIVTHPALTGGLALELAGQAGGLVQLPGQPVAPLVAADACPVNTKPQTYQFVTIPLWLPTATTVTAGDPSWDPATDTAYGSVDVTASGTSVNFANIRHFTLAGAAVTGTAANPVPSSIAGACGPTQYGNTISIPGQIVVTDPNPNPGGTSAPQGIVGIGPSGLLVEDNGLAAVATYQNALGAGTGAIGLPKPAGPLDTGSLTGAQYMGFVYGGGVFSRVLSSSPSGWSSHLASFGFPGSPALPSACSSFAAQTGPLVNGIYGGDFPQLNGRDNPSASANGFGNCDLAIDLGTQDTANNGLYPNATVWMGESYVANVSMTTRSFPAVAIAGQLQGKVAIFLLGKDATQPWAIYLLSTN